MLVAVALCIVAFAVAFRSEALAARRSPLTAYFIGFMGVSAAGVGIFAYPQPLHNVFGLSETIAYQAPLILALSWRRDRSAKAIVTISWVAAILTYIAIAANLSVLDTTSAFWHDERPVYGVVQRSLFAVWFVWCASVGVMAYGDSVAYVGSASTATASENES